ncbi:MAG: oxidoreductase [Acidobacteria bacterium]|nr:oxidoreductase [Acidobacteriota bacterium]
MRQQHRLFPSRPAALAVVAVTLAANLGLAAAGSPSQSAPRWEVFDPGVTESLRGLSAVSADVAWATGSNGRWLRTIDGGRTWQSGQILGAETLGVRDIEAFDGLYAVALTIGSPGRIYRTNDGGYSWDLVYEDDRPDVFFNCMDFADRDRGYAVGDPIDGRFLFIETTDGGKNWAPLSAPHRPEPEPGEAQFAASGTCLQATGNDVWIGTGGSVARVFHSDNRGRRWNAAATPLQQGSAAKGVFGLLMDPDGHGIAVGGDYSLEDDPTDAVALSHDGGASWSAEGITGLTGFRSALASLEGGTDVLVAVGPAGTDISYDAGRSWSAIAGPGFHVTRAADDGAVWAAGADGRVARLAR